MDRTRGRESFIRALAICMFRRGDEILVIEAYDATKRQLFYRPPGGGIQFGEMSEAAVRREMREEMGAEITDLRYLGTLENIFTYNGTRGHEIVQVYEGSFADRTLYSMPNVWLVESDGTRLPALWKQIASFSPTVPLYPEGLRNLILAVAPSVESEA